MRRGFKAEAERIAREARLELSLTSDDRLDPRALAQHLEIPIFGLTQVAQVAPGSSFGEYFSSIDRDSFSAVTIFKGHERLIVHNESHHPNRQASNLSHEISHTLLEHEPTTITALDGQRYWKSEVEQEATWLAGALLVPRDGALELTRLGWRAPKIAVHYGVSEALCTWRIRETGIFSQMQRSRHVWEG